MSTSEVQSPGPRLPRGSEQLVERLAPALHDVPWTVRENIVRDTIRQLRIKADGAAIATVVVSWLMKRSPGGEGDFALAVTCWDKATPRQREHLELAAWRRANPAWVDHIDHDPYPRRGASAPSRA